VVGRDEDVAVAGDDIGRLIKGVRTLPGTPALPRVIDILRMPFVPLFYRVMPAKNMNPRQSRFVRINSPLSTISLHLQNAPGDGARSALRSSETSVITMDHCARDAAAIEYILLRTVCEDRVRHWGMSFPTCQSTNIDASSAHIASNTCFSGYRRRLSALIANPRI